ncbi:hypothetical protein BH11BAC4_BH11BAC4_26490 [soil metagenome]
MNKAALINELMHNTFVMLKPSPVQGIGVFAIAAISKGQRQIFSNDTSEWLAIPKKEIETLPKHSKAVVENFCLYDEENYFVPEYGFKMVDLVIFLNHDANPNIASINDGEDFIALRDISAGEELLIDYGEIVEH